MTYRKLRDDFERAYALKYPDDKCTLLPNGNYSGWVKQKNWKEFQAQWNQSSVDIELTDDEQQEFIQFISRWSVSCYFDGQECIIPTGQGHSVPLAIRTALEAWKYQIKKSRQQEEGNAS